MFLHLIGHSVSSFNLTLFSSHSPANFTHPHPLFAVNHSSHTGYDLLFLFLLVDCRFSESAAYNDSDVMLGSTPDQWSKELDLPHKLDSGVEVLDRIMYVHTTSRMYLSLVL